MLHAPAAYREPFQRGEHQRLQQQADQDHRGQPRKDAVGIELIAVLEVDILPSLKKGDSLCRRSMSRSGKDI